MSNTITIFTDEFVQENMSEIVRLSNAGNLAPISLANIASNARFQSAVETEWDIEKTYTVDETLPEDKAISNLASAFSKLVGRGIEAVTMSIPRFLLLQGQREFNPDTIVTIYLNDSVPESDQMGTLEVKTQKGVVGYKITIHSKPDAEALYEPKLKQTDAVDTKELLQIFSYLRDSKVKSIQMPAYRFLQLQKRSEFKVVHKVVDIKSGIVQDIKGLRL